MNIDPNELKSIQFASFALNNLVKSLDRRVIAIEATQVASQERYLALSNEIAKNTGKLEQLLEDGVVIKQDHQQLIQLLSDFAQLRQDVSTSANAEIERAKESRESFNSIRSALISFAAIGMLTLLFNTLFPNITDRHKEQTTIPDTTPKNDQKDSKSDRR